jgi:hypothetical protein
MWSRFRTLRGGLGACHISCGVNLVETTRAFLESTEHNCMSAEGSHAQGIGEFVPAGGYQSLLARKNMRSQNPPHYEPASRNDSRSWTRFFQ